MKKNLQNLFKKTAQIVFKSFYGNILYSNKYQKIIKKKGAKNSLFKHNKYFTYSIKNGRIYTDYVQNVAIIHKNYLHGDTSFQQVNHKLASPKNNSVLKKGTPRIKKKFKGSILSLVQGASGENYFHWMIDILPKLKIFSSNYNFNNINYLYVPELSSVMKETLNLLKIKKKIINSKNFRHIEANEIISTTHPWYHKSTFASQSNNIPAWSIKWIRNKFLNHKKKFLIKKKIFLDRSDSKYSHCKLINNDEIIKFLLKRNFSIIKCSELNFVKQIFAFWNASEIVGVHGAAFTNIIFSKSNTKIIEIKPYGHDGLYFEKISKINNLNYKSIVSKKKYLKNKSGDTYIPIQILKNKIGY
ncbi:glycosyltransferase family 61 protein [Candidatus Pelagibacter sp.]|nr:glycosyltransferase family 61 protein [Candidatus Pelagibacter sp.]